MEDLVIFIIIAVVGIFLQTRKYGSSGNSGVKRKKPTSLFEMVDDAMQQMQSVERVGPQGRVRSNAQKTPQSMQVVNNYHDEHEAESYCTDEHYIVLDSDYDEHPDVDSIKNTPRKCPFCGAVVRANEAVCHKCHHDI